jgi:Fe2+ transport system protein FeoA
VILKLAQLNEGECGKIIELEQDWCFRKRIAELGFGAGNEIRLIKKILNGPIIIELNRCGRIAIGWGEASKITIKRE